ncbi:MAG TPA: DNA mismatch repair protein MutS [bacterium]|nr:DNA mismatch repair protein MutS [bacterium]
MDDLTPMMRQYLEMKRVYKDQVLFFRLGDFYEMFFEDAKTAARVLHLTLTARSGGNDRKIPMAGIPFHAADNYIAKLVKAGYSIAICEQAEDPALAKGLVKREIARVITPGTILAPSMLEEKANNYLVSVAPSAQGLGLGVVDVTTGEFKACELTGPTRFSVAADELSKFNPSEILIPQTQPETEEWAGLLKAVNGATRSHIEDWKFSTDEGREALEEHFQVKSLEGFGLSGQPQAVRAAGAILQYLKETTHSVLSHLVSLSTFQVGEGMVLDATTQRNLEIVKPMRDDGKEGTLLSVLDETVTSMGGRLLRQWLITPLTSVSAIKRRQDAVEELLARQEDRETLREFFRQVSDLERLAGRIGCGTANARDLVALRTTLSLLPKVHQVLNGFKSQAIRDRVEGWDNLTEIQQLLEKAIHDEPPLALREGGLIKAGYSPELDELKGASVEGKGWIAQLEEKEKQRTGISSLKVRYTSVFGYYIEVSKANLDKVPKDYHRKQTLVNAERFITDELKGMEGKVLGAQEKADKLEYEIFEKVRAQVAQELSRLQRVARALAELDVYACMAAVADRGRYVRPEVDDGPELSIVEGRHPVLDRILSSDQFVPNDTHLGVEGVEIVVLTGPNMAGKSTYIRQVALLSLMAQVGFYVPAQKMKAGIVDRIFSRVGASDALTQGQSTFMVEMVETANILNHATHRSLLILDEVGRGTSTYDGVSIAWAVVEYIATKLKARTLFATHYHELTRLSGTFPNVKNFNIAVREWNEQILFLRKIVEGGTDKSYGIQVARLAGVPKEVVNRAKKILAGLETGTFLSNPSKGPSKETVEAEERPDAGTPDPTAPQLSFFGTGAKHPILEELKGLDVDGLTPRDALNILGEWKKKVEE